MKINLYRRAVCSTLTHASEAWDFTEDVVRAVNGFNSRCLHIITGKSYRETASNPEFDLVKAIRKRRLRYLGHILRMDSQRLVRRTLLAYVNPVPPPGSLLDDCKGKSIASLVQLAADRKKWNRLVNSI